MIQEWHCESCGRSGKTQINDHDDAQSGMDRIADSHRRKSPNCHKRQWLEKVRVRAPHCSEEEWKSVLCIVEGQPGGKK